MEILPNLSSFKWPSTSRLIKEGVVFVLIQFIIIGSNNAAFWSRSNKTPEGVKPPTIQYSMEDILMDSQISYRALGGFTNVRSYSVVISCINGKISILKSIHGNDLDTLREKDTLTQDAYILLWKSLTKQKILTLNDAKEPRLDLLDEFTYHFEARVGHHQNNFKIYGLNRPEGAQYFAIKNLLDKSARMAHLWDRHHALAKK